MVDREVVEAFGRAVGLGRVTGPHARPDPRHQDTWVWQVSSFAGIRALLGLLGPWLGSRRREQFERVLGGEKRARPGWSAEHSRRVRRQMERQWADPVYAARQRARMAAQPRANGRLVKE